MRVTGVSWVGVKAANTDLAASFFAKVLGLPALKHDTDLVVFQMPDGSQLEVFGPNGPDPPHQFARARVVVGFRVDDIDSARRELEPLGVEVIGPLRRDSQTGYAWQHFRGPDGVIYELNSVLVSEGATVAPTNAIRLEPMNEEDFRASLALAIPRYAAECVQQGLWTADNSLEASRSELELLLPQGFKTPNRHFGKLIEEASGSSVGEVWYTVERKGGKVRFWVDWISVDPRMRTRGYATEALELLSAEALKHGADRIGLQVLSDNAVAVALYTRAGFKPTDVRMAKQLNRCT